MFGRKWDRKSVKGKVEHVNFRKIIENAQPKKKNTKNFDGNFMVDFIGKLSKGAFSQMQ